MHYTTQINKTKVIHYSKCLQKVSFSAKDFRNKSVHFLSLVNFIDRTKHNK